MGTIIIKNLSRFKDKFAVTLVSDYWNCKDSGVISGVMDFMKESGVEIKKKGHTFTVVDLEKENDR